VGQPTHLFFCLVDARCQPHAKPLARKFQKLLYAFGSTANGKQGFTFRNPFLRKVVGLRGRY